MRWAVRPCSWPISRPSSPTGATTTFRISSRRSRGRIRSTAVFTNATIPRSIPSTSNRSSTVCGGASTSAAPPRRRVWKDSTSAGKTGTAENPRGRDHSTFLSFAPKDNPKIAISVYVENGGFGASAALPIASLLEEYYLTDTIRRPALLEHIKNMNIYYPSYDR